MEPAQISRQDIVAAFQKQADWCAQLGSPFTAQVLGLLMENIVVQGPAADLVAEWPTDPIADALALRLCGGLHALVLSGEAPALAALYPPNPAPEAAKLARELNATLAGHRQALRRFLQSPPQTNEVGRSAVLLGGFLTIAEATGQPLRLLEIGASGGLNMLWDKYQYQLGGMAWGKPDCRLRLAPRWRGNAPPAAPIQVVSRAGCDIAPIDVADPEVALRLRAYVWPDQLDRLARMDAAIEIACIHCVQVARADAADWLRQELTTPLPGATTVVYHSLMWQYMRPATQAEIEELLYIAGENASGEMPLAWLRFEPQPLDAPPELHLTLWPGAHRQRLAIAHPHGAGVHWLV